MITTIVTVLFGIWLTLQIASFIFMAVVGYKFTKQLKEDNTI